MPCVIMQTNWKKCWSEGISMDTRYEYYEENGKTYALDTVTGVITDAITATFPAGTKIRTPAQQEAYQKYEKDTALLR